MGRKLLTLLLIQIILGSCQGNANSSATSAESVPEVPEAPESIPQYDYNMQPDSIEIRGSFSSSCNVPGTVKLREYNVMYSRYKQVSVDQNGKFTYKIYLREPRQITMKTGKSNFDFFITTKEKVYQVEITCDGSNREKVEVKNSNENAAFRSFYKTNHGLKNTMSRFEDQDISDSETFNQVREELKNYQEELDEIAKKYPETYTAVMLCASETLPEATLASPDALRKNYLQKQVLAKPEYYTNFLSSRIFTIYFYAIFDKKDPSFSWFENAMNIALKNKEAAKRIQQIVHDMLYYGRREELLIKYVNWFQDNPEKSHNPHVKTRLQKISKTLAGSPMIDIELNDVNGKPRKLSETVASNKLTLLTVWSPDCGHCRQEMPQLGPVWDEYKSKGLGIYSIAFDSSEEDWKGFVNDHLRDWDNVFEPSSGNPPTSKYVINYTPTFILFDQDGTILHRFPNLEKVKEIIAERLK